MKQEEIFPLVDSDGTVTGKATRSHCHDGSMLLHPVIHLHIFDSKGNLFLQKRSAKKDIFPHLWDTSVGGHIDWGETPAQAVLREANEELNLSNLDICYIGKHVMQTQFERELTYCYYAISDQKPQPDMDEVSDGRFWTLNEIGQKIGSGVFTPNFEYDFKSFLSEGVGGIVIS